MSSIYSRLPGLSKINKIKHTDKPDKTANNNSKRAAKPTNVDGVDESDKSGPNRDDDCATFEYNGDVMALLEAAELALPTNDTSDAVELDDSQQSLSEVSNDIDEIPTYENRRIKSSSGWCTQPHIIDVISYLIGMILIVLAVTFVVFASDAIIHHISGKALFLYDIGEGPTTLLDREKYDFWTPKNVFMISLAMVPFSILSYVGAMSVVNMEVANLCITVMGIQEKEKHQDVLRRSAHFTFEHRRIPNPNDISILRRRIVAENQESEGGSNDVQHSEKLGEPQEHGCLNISWCDTKTTRDVGETFDQTGLEELEPVLAKTSSCWSAIFYACAYVTSVITCWLIVKIFSFQIYGTMTISNVNASMKISRYEWLGALDAYVFLYNIVSIPIIFSLSKKLTSDVVVDTLSYLRNKK